jgi:8-oxo-dGTP pyrophosphatase MutT (NUDIX family)
MGALRGRVSQKHQRLYHSSTLILNRETVTFPDGKEAELEIVRHPGGAAVVALNNRDEVCLIRQYRHAAGGWIWEVPAGRREPDEAPLLTAQRELAEEVGLQARDWQSLGEMLPSPGIFDERIHLYLAQGLSETSVSHDELEYIEMHWVPLPQAMRWAIDGEISDAKTLVALFRTQDLVSSRTCS